MRRVLVSSTALLWGLQIAFLNPALALILVSLYGATTSQVGWVLAVYNASGFLASLLVPAYADRRRNYLRLMLGCAVLTLVLALLLALTTSLPLVVVALVLVGGPAGVGSSLLFAHLRHAGARVADIVNTRAIVSLAWVGGPPLATLIIGTLGNRAILLAVAGVALLSTTSTAALARAHRPADPTVASDAIGTGSKPTESRPPSRSVLVLVLVSFVLLQAGNATTTSFLTVYVTQALHAPVVWAGVALGIAAGLEVPALILIGRLGAQASSFRLLATGTLAAIGYYLGVAATPGPVLLLALQPLNAWAFASIAGVGLPLFQELIARPGLATGLFMNTRRVGAIASGPLIALGSLTVVGDRGVFLGCAVITAAALAVLAAASRTATREQAA